ncbi:DUF4145 domain-containing protein [Listeria monocytogenes]
MTFKNENYVELSTDLIHDIFYSNISSRGRIASIRQYTEILFRKCLDLDEEQSVMLGKKELIKQLKEISNNDPLVINALETIRTLGNNYTHTQYTGKVDVNDEEKAFDALLDVSAYIFVDYFTKYKFGKNNKVLTYFSYLPPSLRV